MTVPRSLSRISWGCPPSRRRLLPSPFIPVIAAAICLIAPSARAGGDGVYGRLDGDLDLAAAAGAALSADAVPFVARVSATYVATAGLYVHYADTFGQEGAREDRSLAVGVALKPVFWARFANANESGPARLDLFVDSFTFELGAFWSAPRSRSFESSPGLELAASLGFPFFSHASGPFLELRGALRFSRDDLAARTPNDPIARGAMLSLTLAWHQILPAHIADAGDRVVH